MRRQLRVTAVFVAIAVTLLALLTTAAVPALADGQRYTTLQELDGHRIGVQGGSTFDQIVNRSLPNAKISYYNSASELVEALSKNKIDAFAADEPALRLMAAENPGTVILDEMLDTFEFGAIMPKTDAGRALKQEFDDWLDQMRETGELERMTIKWTEGMEAEKTVPDWKSLPATKGVLTMATECMYPPMNYYRDHEAVGMEIEMVARFCADRGYALKIDTMNFDSILPAISTGKADIALAGISITDERRESVLFSEPYYEGGTAVAVYDATQAAHDGASQNLWGSLVERFEKTFIRERRWLLFLEGVGTTLLITFLSIVLGTLLGFVVYLLCRNGGRIANGVTGACMWLLQGMPGVVLLMVLYYIVFGSFSISGVVVSVIGFTLTFGTTVFGLIKTGVGAVDTGQGEAASALGYNRHETFFKIILPQALPHITEPFRGEVINLIKATSIVGYIAVQDLTKMGDLIRSRTYDAFFPLLAVTVIYFALEGLLGLVVSRIQISFDPRRRDKDDILKGVVTDD